MTPIAIVFMLLAMLVVWGILAVAIVFLARHPEVAAYPDGDEVNPTGELLR